LTRLTVTPRYPLLISAGIFLTVLAANSIRPRPGIDSRVPMPAYQQVRTIESVHPDDVRPPLERFVNGVRRFFGGDSSHLPKATN